MIKMDNSMPYGISSMNSSIMPINNYMEYNSYNNIFKDDIGKYIEIYSTFPKSKEWRNKVFKGIIIKTGKDFIKIEEEVTGRQILILMNYIDYVIL
jgi:spore coat protein GerQ